MSSHVPTREGWRFVLEAGPLSEGHEALSAWRAENPEVEEEDVMVDVIRAVGHDRLRVWVRA